MAICRTGSVRYWFLRSSISKERTLDLPFAYQIPSAEYDDEGEDLLNLITNLPFSAVRTALERYSLLVVTTFQLKSV